MSQFLGKSIHVNTVRNTVNARWFGYDILEQQNLFKVNTLLSKLVLFKTGNYCGIKYYQHFQNK